VIRLAISFTFPFQIPAAPVNFTNGMLGGSYADRPYTHSLSVRDRIRAPERGREGLVSEWTSRITNHRIWALMKALGPTIDKSARLDDLEPTAIEELERLRSILAICGKRLGGSDPLTVLPSLVPSAASESTL
jgi:hypothetical protein